MARAAIAARAFLVLAARAFLVLGAFRRRSVAASQRASAPPPPYAAALSHEVTHMSAAFDREVNDLICQGKAMEAFEKFYADGVEMSENFDAPCVGKDANRKREYEFFGKVEQVKSAELLAQSYDEKTGAGFSEWDWDVVFKGGFATRMRQVGVRRWKDGQVVHERFYYKPAM
jgi:hypothetical protein